VVIEGVNSSVIRPWMKKMEDEVYPNLVTVEVGRRVPLAMDKLKEDQAFKDSVRGPKGNTGPIGPQGPQGDTGPQGPQGAKGEVGPAATDAQVSAAVERQLPDVIHIQLPDATRAEVARQAPDIINRNLTNDRLRGIFGDRAEEVARTAAVAYVQAHPDEFLGLKGDPGPDPDLDAVVRRIIAERGFTALLIQEFQADARFHGHDGVPGRAPTGPEIAAAVNTFMQDDHNQERFRGDPGKSMPKWAWVATMLMAGLALLLVLFLALGWIGPKAAVPVAPPAPPQKSCVEAGGWCGITTASGLSCPEGYEAKAELGTCQPGGGCCTKKATVAPPQPPTPPPTPPPTASLPACATVKSQCEVLVLQRLAGTREATDEDVNGARELCSGAAIPGHNCQ